MAVMQGPPSPEVQEVAPKTMGAPKIYPKDKEQAEQFLLSIVKVIHQNDSAAEHLSKAGEMPISSIIAVLAAKVLTLMFTQVYKQTNGAQVVASFAVEAVRRAVTEIAEIAEVVLGRKITRKEVQEAAKISGDSVQKTMDELADGEQAQTPGVMQGPPQEGGM